MSKNRIDFVPPRKDIPQRPKPKAPPSRVTMYLTDEASQKLRDVAQANGISQQEFLRYGFDLALRSYGVAPVKWPEDGRKKRVADDE